MEDVLERINQTPGVEASLIVGKDGLLITSLGDAEPDPDFLGAETAELLQAIETNFRTVLSFTGEIRFTIKAGSFVIEVQLLTSDPAEAQVLTGVFNLERYLKLVIRGLGLV